jgi:RNA polymerase sigma-70 factor (ECF subfamily)
MTAATPALGVLAPSLSLPSAPEQKRVAGARAPSREELAAVSIDVEAYYRQYGPMVLRRCRAMLRDEDKARDAMQDTFVQLLRHKDRLEHDAPSSLLYRMATNVCLNRIRSSKRKPEDKNEDLLLRIANADDPERATGARALLGRVFAKEKESTRTIAVLHLLDGMTLEEVAREVGMSVSGVRKRLRGLKASVQELEELSS